MDFSWGRCHPTFRSIHSWVNWSRKLRWHLAYGWQEGHFLFRQEFKEDPFLIVSFPSFFILPPPRKRHEGLWLIASFGARNKKIRPKLLSFLCYYIMSERKENSPIKYLLNIWDSTAQEHYVGWASDTMGLSVCLFCLFQPNFN